MSTFSYDPAKVIVTFRGILVTGFATDTFISGERSEDTWTMEVGADGDVTRTLTRNRTGFVTITLKMASPSNGALSSVAVLDENTGAGIGPLAVKDLNGSTRLSSAESWIRRMPNFERAAQPTTVEWIIDCANLTITHGGFV